MSEQSFIWLDCLQLNPGMSENYEEYLQLEIDLAQKEMDVGVDNGDSLKAARAKGKRDAYSTLLYHVRSRTS